MEGKKYVVANGAEEFAQHVHGTSGVVMVDFYADWCGPCKMIAPVIEELAAEYEGKATVMKVDVDQASDVAGQYSVMSIPTVIMFVNGKEADRKVGAMSKEQYAAWIDSFLSGMGDENTHDAPEPK